jgi:2TM domain-containing protein
MQSSTREPLSPQPPPDLASRPPGPDEERLARARRRLAALKGFYIHLFVFATVLAGLTIVNIASGGPWWVLWVLLGWGIGILAHAITVFGRSPQAIADWEERKLRQFLDER